MENGLYISPALIAAALALDLALGDPSWMPHPVRVIGRAVTLGEARLRTGEPRTDFWRGAILVCVVVILTALAAWVAIATAWTVANWLGQAAALLIAWTTLALNGLDRAAGEVEHRARLGRAERAANMADIATARRLMRIATAIGFCLLAILRYVLCGC